MNAPQTQKRYLTTSIDQNALTQALYSHARYWRVNTEDDFGAWQLVCNMKCHSNSSHMVCFILFHSACGPTTTDWGISSIGLPDLYG